ncbi:MAG: gamma carbonic anhydrase family protein [Candidatus Methanomethyliaceae archaeon]|nr:gamma carbonic anhydrase family protein [Candidatus Methanomethyliaceae archaeon]MDW7970826.1 gamma carbonic anhydrase family protein [Nitrososphaerota archaeon]
MIKELNGKKPIIDPSAYIHEMALVIGDVIIGGGTNIWPFAVLRGDIERITIGRNVSIQDGAILHTDYDFPVVIGDECIIAHRCVIHGCKIGNNSLIGIGAIILSGAEIGENCIVAAGALVPEEKKIPSNSVIMGIPAKIVREINEKDVKRIKKTLEDYKKITKLYG